MGGASTAKGKGGSGGSSAKGSGGGKAPQRKVTDINPRPDGTWEEKDRGATRARKVSDTKTEVVQAAVERARQDQAAGELRQVVIRKADGTIQSERTYGKDPERLKG